MKTSEITWVDKNICVCNNCGGYSDKEATIKHYKTCQKGESEKWEEFYSEKGDK